MRKNCARKWLHLIIDLLPVLILPIFAIWEINHKENEFITVDVTENKNVDFNQLALFSNNQIPSTADGITYSTSDNKSVTLNGSGNTNRNGWFNLSELQSFSGRQGHKIYFDSTYLSGDFSVTGTMYFYFTGSGRIEIGESYIHTLPNQTQLRLGFATIDSPTFNDYTITFKCIDLTDIFGAGNEPVLSAIESYFPNDFYAYTLSKPYLIENYATVTLDNTDIGSQMLYALYKPVQQYFNFDNVFNFGALRNWFELNFFNGNMGIPMTIIWNIIIYEFLSDVIMLIYAFFMFIIDFANDLLEKPFSDIKRG